MPYYVRGYYNSQNQYPANNYNYNNLLYDVGLPTLLGIGLGPIWGIGAALLRNSGQTTIINIRTGRNNCMY